MISQFFNTQISLGSLVFYLVLPACLGVGLALRKFFVNLVKYFFEGILDIASRVSNQHIAKNLSLRRYCLMQIEGSSKYLSVPGIIDTALDIDKIFVPLKLSHSGTSSNYEHHQILDIGKRIRVIGDPGSGKTSFSKRVFRDECQYLSGQKKRFRKLPILIDLKKMEIPKNISAKKLGDWIFNHVKTSAASFDVYAMDQCFDISVRNSGLLLILDGLDEVSSQLYPKVEEGIIQISQVLQRLSPNNFVILTMRTQFHRQVRDSYKEEFPIVLELKRFTPSDIFQFLTRWPFSSHRKQSEIIRIYNELTDQPALREMCTNPLILAMYVSRDQASGESLSPESRTDFYSQVTEELLIRRRSRQVGAAQSQSLIREQRQRILGRIALNHICNSEESANLIPISFGIEAIRDYTNLELEESLALLRVISKDTGLITEDQEGENFRFIHLTFCEFFAAIEASQGSSDGWNKLVQQHRVFLDNQNTRSRLSEVIPFTAALMPGFRKEEIVNTVAQLAETRTVALTYLETKAYNTSSWPTFIERFRNSLLSKPQNSWDQDWLRELHLFLVVASDAVRASELMKDIKSTEILQDFFEQVLLSGMSQFSNLISGFSQQDAAVAFRIATICGVNIAEDMPDVVIDNLNQSPFLAIVLEKAAKSKDPKNWACLFAEAGLRSEGTAALLLAVSERPWRYLVEEIPSNRHWKLPRFIPDSYYSDCLTIAFSENSHSDRRLRLVSKFRMLISPNQKFYMAFFAKYISKNPSIYIVMIYSIFGITGMLYPEYWSILKIPLDNAVKTNDYLTEYLLPHDKFKIYSVLLMTIILVSEIAFITIYRYLWKESILFSMVANTSTFIQNTQSNRILSRVLRPQGIAIDKIDFKKENFDLTFARWNKNQKFINMRSAELKKEPI